MRYQQTPTSRLSKASAWLQADGAWHPFAAEDGVHYRVSGKIMQRVRLETHEDAALLRLFDSLPPLPPKLFKEGFREELRFVLEDDHYLLTDILIRVYVGWDTLAKAAESFGFRMSFPGGNTLHCSVVFHAWSADSIMKTLILTRAFTTVAAQLAQDSYEGIPHTKGEIAGLLRSANDFFMEELFHPIIQKPQSGSIMQQEELF